MTFIAALPLPSYQLSSFPFVAEVDAFSDLFANTLGKQGALTEFLQEIQLMSIKLGGNLQV